MTTPRIALLDNDPAALSLLHELLTDEGYRTLHCRPDDMVSAHALMKRARPALVILDLWSAKREGGRAFLTHLWGDGETAYIPAIITSGPKEMPPRQDEMLRTTRCQVLGTPFDARELLRAIETVLGPSPAGIVAGDPAILAVQ